MKIEFHKPGVFQALYAAEDWCKKNRISVGAMERGKPRGLLHGDVVISKWRNMSQVEIVALDGRMTGDFRNGPVIIEINEPCAEVPA